MKTFAPASAPSSTSWNASPDIPSVTPVCITRTDGSGRVWYSVGARAGTVHASPVGAGGPAPSDAAARRRLAAAKHARDGARAARADDDVALDLDFKRARMSIFAR